MPKPPPLPPAPTEYTSHTSAIEPRVFRSIEFLCKEALHYSNNHYAVRQAIGGLHKQLRSRAHSLFGHDSPDVINLLNFLRRTDPEYQAAGGDRPAPNQDQIQLLQTREQLTPDQTHAARCIRDIWAAWGRYLSVTSRSYQSGGGGGAKKVLQPLDVMGEEIWELWRERYKPWYNQARFKSVVSEINTLIRTTTIIVDIVVENYTPRQVDLGYRLRRGTALFVLRRELTLFVDPNAMLPKKEFAHAEVSRSSSSASKKPPMDKGRDNPRSGNPSVQTQSTKQSDPKTGGEAELVERSRADKKRVLGKGSRYRQGIQGQRGSTKSKPQRR